VFRNRRRLWYAIYLISRFKRRTVNLPTVWRQIRVICRGVLVYLTKPTKTTKKALFSSDFGSLRR
jgi:hypothetical protein